MEGSVQHKTSVRVFSDSVEAIYGCANVRGRKGSGQNRDEWHWVDTGLAKKLYSKSKGREAEVMLLNSALRRRCKTSLYLSRSSNKSKITDAWPGIWIFLGQDRMYIRGDSSLLRPAFQCSGKRCQVSPGTVWSDAHLREILAGLGMLLFRATAGRGAEWAALWFRF